MAHGPARGPRPRHLAELTGAADLPPPPAEDLDRLAELREANFGLDSRTAS